MPRPKATVIVCDTCGLDWKRHKANKRGTVTTAECVRLLKADLAAAETRAAYRPPVQLPWVQPVIRPWTPYWQSPNTGGWPGTTITYTNSSTALPDVSVSPKVH